MEQKKLKWKDVYNNNKQRSYSEVTGIKKENVEIESNSFRILKEHKYLSIVVILLILALLIYTFRGDIKILLMVIAFTIFTCLGFFVFNYFKFKCQKEGLYIRFGLQEGLFTYDKLKYVYLSKYSDSNFFIPVKRVYSIVIRYVDNFGKTKELSFPNYFLSTKETEEFLNNFEIKETEPSGNTNYERFKLLKLIGKSLLFIIFVLFVIGLLVYGR